MSLGTLLKNRRRELDLTQHDLARAVNISPSALQKYETGDRRPSRAMAARLADALALAAPARERFLRAARGGDSDEASAAAAVVPAEPPYPAGLPAPLTGLLGRERELATLGPRLLGPARLLTLTGSPGVGKTRLALALAARVGPRLHDGPWFVDLAPLADANLVADTIARRLGLSERPGQSLAETLVEYVREREMLLLLDNFEQLIAATPLLGRLLAAASRLRILVTSRVPLRLYGEYAFVVEPLEREAAQAAVQLFAERAQAANGRFELSALNEATVAAICERLDGLPLAIELAAARVGLLAPATLLELIERQALELSADEHDRPERQQTLHRAISWSYALLDPAERQLLASLAVFVGGCGLAATEAVCGGAGERPLIDGLGRLVGASLLRSGVDGAGESRFAMLETIRAFAALQLAQSPRAEQLRAQHGAYFASLAAQSLEELRGPQQGAWLERLDRELPNLRAAMAWAIAGGQSSLALGLAGSLTRYWLLRGYLSEGANWIEQALALADSPGIAPEDALAARANALQGSGILAAERGDMARAHERFAAALPLWRQAAAPARVAGTLNNLGIMAMNRGAFGDAIPLLEEAVALGHTLGDRWGVANAQNNLAIALLELGAYRRAVDALRECLAINREVGDESSILANLINLGLPLSYLGQAEAALACYREALERGAALDQLDSVASCCEGLAYLALGAGRVVRAVRLLGASEGLRTSIGAQRQPVFQPTYNQMLQRSKARLAPARWQAAYAAGAALPLAAVISEALAQ